MAFIQSYMKGPVSVVIKLRHEEDKTPYFRTNITISHAINGRNIKSVFPNRDNKCAIANKVSDLLLITREMETMQHLSMTGGDSDNDFAGSIE